MEGNESAAVGVAWVAELVDVGRVVGLPREVSEGREVLGRSRVRQVVTKRVVLTGRQGGEGLEERYALDAEDGGDGEGKDGVDEVDLGEVVNRGHPPTGVEFESADRRPKVEVTPGSTIPYTRK